MYYIRLHYVHGMLLLLGSVCNTPLYLGSTYTDLKEKNRKHSIYHPHYIISSSSQVGDRLSLTVTPDQSLVFYMNGENLGVAMADVPHGLYGFVDLWAECTSVRIISHPIQVPPNSDLKTSTPCNCNA